MSDTKKVPAWPAQTRLDRLDACRAMLYIHGFLAERENANIRIRLIRARGKKAQGRVIR